MEENKKIKIRTNGRPKMEAKEKKASTIQVRVNEAERKIFENLHQRFAPHLSEAEFARVKILDNNITLFGIRDIPEEEREILREIALLGSHLNLGQTSHENDLTI